MALHCSASDRDFVEAFETCTLPLPFAHRDHVRLAYVLLLEMDVAAVHDRVREGLVRFLAHHDVPATKFPALTVENGLSSRPNPQR